MYEERGHLVVGMRDNGIPPHHNGREHRTIGKTETGGEEVSPDGGPQQPVWQPEIHEYQGVGEVAKVEEEIVEALFLVSIPAIWYQNKEFLQRQLISHDSIENCIIMACYAKIGYRVEGGTLMK